ncbi:MAG: retroviral-like aspartic protease family protein [Rhizobacter sp.]
MNSWTDRREPVLADEPAVGGDAHDRLEFMQDAQARSRRAGWAVWLGAASSLALFAWLTSEIGLNERASSAYRVGQMLATVFWPLLVVAVAKLLNQRRSQRTLVLVFMVSCLVLSALTVLHSVYRRGGLKHLLNKESLTAQDHLTRARHCGREGDLACQEESWRDYIALRPTDATGPANLGMVLNHRDRHAEATEQFKAAITLGEGTYDLFAYYADSLNKLGQTEQAIEWNYKALSIVPSLVDVRGQLAKLLVGAKRPYEALVLLQAYDTQLEGRGQPAYFSGQRIAIEAAIEQDATPTAEQKSLRLPSLAGHYFAPVTLGSAKPVPFMVDTGATRTVVSEKLLKESKARYRITHTDVQMVTADGRKVAAQAATIESMSIGWFKLKNQLAIVCQDCAPLLGQSTLSGFDMQSSKVAGVESLVLTQRR